MKKHLLFPIILIAITVIACSLETNIPFPSTNVPTPITPNIKYTQAIFKTNYSGIYSVNPNAVINLGKYNIDFSKGYKIETSDLNDNIFIFNIIYTNSVLTKGIKKIFFTNGIWDNVGNYQMLEILNSQEASLHDLILILIEDPNTIYSWREKIKADGKNLYFMGTNIATKI